MDERFHWKSLFGYFIRNWEAGRNRGEMEKCIGRMARFIRAKKDGTNVLLFVPGGQ
jgi:hypothetical protein